ncbi:DUF4198 domain-containing protein [Suttonella sp. R2A3]|uniref:DUF4198 domain-containing protein n=1 Tax=Suttonella sp. R2A3 TaxID=2908648 RepID=UPI001F470D9A|nr:DUF4198 domain-containing protein [Suttonella sp. R2A3]UJF23925.1 DUF4198 domain-containing protein [Suttonella sp. R2A3]
MKKILLSAFLLTSGAALAHGVWVAPHYGELGIVYGMGAIDDQYSPEKVQKVMAYDANFQPVSVEVVGQGNHSAVNPAEDAAVITASFNNGYWEKGETVKWQAVDKAAISNPADTSTSLKYNISLMKPYQGEMVPFDLPVQVIPETDPSTLAQGDSLTVTVYVDGEPQADVPVTADYVGDAKNQQKTNAEGQVTLTVRNAGLNVVTALVNHPTPDDEYAHLQRSVATLSFKSAAKH